MVTRQPRNGAGRYGSPADRPRRAFLMTPLPGGHFTDRSMVDAGHAITSGLLVRPVTHPQWSPGADAEPNNPHAEWRGAGSGRRRPRYGPGYDVDIGDTDRQSRPAGRRPGGHDRRGVGRLITARSRLCGGMPVSAGLVHRGPLRG